jgi:hypothetical protein
MYRRPAARKNLQRFHPLSFLACCGPAQREDLSFRVFQPILATVAGHVHGQLKAAPDAEFVERAAQVILDDLLRKQQCFVL